MRTYIYSIIILVIGALSLFILISQKKFGEIPFRQSKEEVIGSSNLDNEMDLPIIKIKDKVVLNVPIINQLPELPRGCEVTSLAMLLQYKGIAVDKMELANKILKDQTPLQKEGSHTYWGHPNDGFIGDMFSYNNPGYGVYHLPIKELAEEYIPGQVVDLTGRDFKELKTFLSLGSPVWVITNVTNNRLPDNSFETWQTPRGEVNITYRLHSILLTGYDEKYVYFNDPLKGEKNMKVLAENFIAAWEQLGSQAISYIDQHTIESNNFRIN